MVILVSSPSCAAGAAYHLPTGMIRTALREPERIAQPRRAYGHPPGATRRLGTHPTLTSDVKRSLPRLYPLVADKVFLRRRSRRSSAPVVHPAGHPPYTNRYTNLDVIGRNSAIRFGRFSLQVSDFSD